MICKLIVHVHVAFKYSTGAQTDLFSFSSEHAHKGTELISMKTVITVSKTSHIWPADEMFWVRI